MGVPTSMVPTAIHGALEPSHSQALSNSATQAIPLPGSLASKLVVAELALRCLPSLYMPYRPYAKLASPVVLAGLAPSSLPPISRILASHRELSPLMLAELASKEVDLLVCSPPLCELCASTGGGGACVRVTFLNFVSIFFFFAQAPPDGCHMFQKGGGYSAK